MAELDCEKRVVELDARGEIDLAVEQCEKYPCSENSKCQRYLGWVYANRHEFEKATDWYLKAATQGDAEAIEECWALVHTIDALGEKSLAMELCQKAPLSEHTNFQRYLAKRYFERGDIYRTLHWSLRIAEHGEADDLLYVGSLYLSRSKPKLALDFLTRAATAGSVRAHQLLGEMYGFGIGVTRDIEVATRYYQESANKGYLLSQVRLLHLKRHEGSFAKKIAFVSQLALVTFRVLIIKFKNPQDPRVADIPDKREWRNEGGQ